MKELTYEELQQKLARTEKELAKLKSEARIFRDMYSAEYVFSFENKE